MMKDLYLKYEEVLNYLIVGVLTTLINVVCYTLFSKVIHIDYMISTVLAWILSVFFAYVANKKVVFKSHVDSQKELLKECFEFFEFRIVSLLMEMGLMYLFVSLFHFDDVISKLVINFVVIVANYFFSKLFVFKKKEIR